MLYHRAIQQGLNMILYKLNFSAGPWTIFAPTNEAFMNLPMTYLENMIRNPNKLSKLILNHMANKTLFKEGLKSHQQVQMANGNVLNLYARPGKYTKQHTMGI